jgi:hypothetical protein
VSASMTLDIAAPCRAPVAANRMTEAAQKLLFVLDPPRRAATMFPFSDQDPYR